MLKNLFYICLFLLFCNKSEAQNYLSIVDSCHYYLDKQDTMSFNKTYIRILDAYEKEYDAELYSIGKELKEMRIEDQSIRLLLIDASKKKRNVDKIRRIMNDIDRRNAVRVTEIIDQYGWLSPDDIGYEANQALFLCIQHSEDSLIQNRYLPILKEAVQKGAAKGWQYAFLTDRCLMNQGQKQIYGTQRIIRNGVCYLVPLQDINKVDSLRKEMGLEPLSEYMKDCGLKNGWSKEFYRNNIKLHESIFNSWFQSFKRKKNSY